MDLSKRDFQLFFKRVRKWHDSNGKFRIPLKYYAVGEYGGKFRRPHFHFLVFNADLSAFIGEKYANAHERGTLQLDGQTEYDCPLWEKGHITIGRVTGASVGYTMKYMSKPWRPMHSNDDRTPQFSLMSKGLGKSYLTGAMIKWHLSDMYKRQYVVTSQGQKVSMPRYYKDKLLTLQDKEIIRAWNVLESMKEQEPKKNSSRERGEALISGIHRYNLSLLKNQKL